MSRQASEKHLPGKQKTLGPAFKPPSKFVSFYPTEAEKDAIRLLQAEFADDLERLQYHVVRGISFSLSVTKSGESLVLSMREASASYDEGQVLACFHSDVGRLVKMALYLLDTKYPSWPEKPAVPGTRPQDW